MPRKYDDCLNDPRCSSRAARYRCDSCKKHHADYMRDYCRRNAETVNANKRAAWAKRSDEQKEHTRAYRRKWFKTPAGRVASARGRHGRLSRKEELSPGSWLITLQSDPCSYCGGPGGEVDHIVPIAQGGSNDLSNLTAACRRCNALKKDQHMLVFMTSTS